MDVQYMGDPALIPIQSGEVTFLVRFFHTIASKINETVRISNSYLDIIRVKQKKFFFLIPVS